MEKVFVLKNDDFKDLDRLNSFLESHNGGVKLISATGDGDAYAYAYVVVEY